MEGKVPIMFITDKFEEKCEPGRSGTLVRLLTDVLPSFPTRPNRFTECPTHLWTALAELETRVQILVLSVFDHHVPMMHISVGL